MANEADEVATPPWTGSLVRLGDLDDVSKVADESWKKLVAWAKDKDLIYIDGANLYSGSVNADKINVNDLFALNIEAKFKMEDKTYSITLADGTVIGDLKLNGNNFISKSPIAKEMFEDCCSPVVISDGEVEETHNNMELVQITPMGEEYWFVLRDISKAEMEKIKMQSDIEYIAMMAGVEL